ncbi:uncharacterized protein BDR25DRAFT_35981 [Lindgomyces ingoldianus]|uniref:Uncharacterized protein n=1 Tax=Lindgomyces ingoldianus TaxID=673940 RepID=A0ACB6QTV2_9PLEO|nr:uncharacterized protein BDR25DRAFT_35981 [Lindgomyces ingoldianus]KAF2470003.1 hypothetical protein BDR25DRAFT_35981 [Lindgomyces ingoldianus]
MLPQNVIILLVAAVSAVPLNINLGAYSPALVVGDGEISLGSTESASRLMETLASGAAANGGEQQGQQAKARDIAAPAPNVRTIEHFGKREAAVADAKETLALAQEAMAWIKRDIAGFREALGYAREAMKDTPKIELGTPASGVGITVNAGLNVPANSAANGAPAGGARQKRDSLVEEESEAPKMTLVAITEV